MQIVIPPGPSGNIIATIAIGEKYFKEWINKAFPTWNNYCCHHQLGLIVFDEDLVEQDNKYWKKATWQKMLIGSILKSSSLMINNICYLDTDILISPLAPNIFDYYDSNKIGLVSLRNQLPYPYHKVLKRLAFLRHTFYDNSYPLDSALFMSLDQLYQYHNLPPQQDEACMGLIMFNMRNHANIMHDWFCKYDRNVESVTGGGDQTHVNYEIQNWGNVQWLEYAFQAIWVFEMAWKYPFLYYDFDRTDENLIRECIEASLYANNFLHFAGSWHESDMWKIGGFFEDSSQTFINKYHDYLFITPTGAPKGIIKP